MQFSKNWLKDFIDLDLSTEEICYQLTMAGIEVDYFESRLGFNLTVLETRTGP